VQRVAIRGLGLIYAGGIDKMHRAEPCTELGRSLSTSEVREE
jgi:hypothetical protein